MTKRYFEFDYIRALAAVAVIVIHVTSLYVLRYKEVLVVNQFVRFSVPIFVILSGLLLLISDDGLKGISFFNKRINKIIVPFFVWTIFYVLFANINNFMIGKIVFPDLVKLFLRGLLYGNGYDHLYFITIMIQCYILYYPLKYLINKWQLGTFFVSGVITLAYQTGVYLMQMSIVKLPWSPLPYYEFFPTWLFYFVFGMIIAKNIDNVKAYLKKKTVLLGVTWFVTFVILLLDGKFSKVYDSIRPSIMLYTLGSFFFIYSFLINYKSPTERLSNFIKWFSNQSYVVYLSHLFFMKATASLIYRMGISTYLNDIVYLILLFIGTMSSTLVFAFLSSKTPFSALLGGVSSKKILPPVKL